jgi:hypothetical protein
MVVSTEGNPSVAFVDLGGDGFVDAALQGMSGPAATKAIEVEPIPNVLGDDSSSSEGGGDDVGEEALPGEHCGLAKASLVEEFEDESGDGPPPA